MYRPIVMTVMMVAATLALPASARAHTDLDYTLPANGATVGEPIDQITVAFTQPVTLVGNGFQVFDPQGEVVVPTPITDDDVVFRLILDEPLAGGEVGVIYEVTSADGHVVSGGFRFLVDAPVPTTTASTSPATQATTASTEPSMSTTEPPASVAPTPSTVAATEPATLPTDGPRSELEPNDADGGGGSAGLIIGSALAVAIGAAAFVMFRGRTAG